MTKLSDTQRVVLSRAAQHETLLATPPAKLPAAARNAVLRSLTAKGLLEEIPAPREFAGLGWRQDEDGVQFALRITPVGLVAIGVGRPNTNRKVNKQRLHSRWKLTCSPWRARETHRRLFCFRRCPLPVRRSMGTSGRL